MVNIHIIFVEPESEDNVGALARVMANFDFKNLIIVNPKVNVFSEKVKVVSREKGWEIIKNCKIFDDFDEVIAKFSITYGTTGIFGRKSSELLRNPITPRELANKIWKYEGDVGIFFGRESTGFDNYELGRFDSIITIPTSIEYPIMNITHAAAIILYELYVAKHNPIRKTFKLINQHERYLLKRTFKEFIYSLPLQEYRKSVAYRGIRNIIGKSIITKREYTTWMGILRKAIESIKKF